MHKLYTSLIISAICISVKAQTPVTPTPTTQPYGTVSKEDLEMKACDFEKDANAMVLFNSADVYYDQDFKLIGEYHKRIKIFNDNGKNEANIRVEFYGGRGVENIYSIDAETINLVNGKTEITKLDRKLFYLQHIDKNRFAWVFTMPNVKAGSVIEYKYRWTTVSIYDFPNWYFQERIPTRYSQLHTEIPDMITYKTQVRTLWGLFSKRSTTSEIRYIGSGTDAAPYTENMELWGMVNVRSLPSEPYMSSYIDNLQSILFELVAVKPVGGLQNTFSGNWPAVGGSLMSNDDFGDQFDRKLANEDAIISKARALKTDEQKIDYVFNQVKNTMKWNEVDRWYTNDGTPKAWETKAGNSTEINLILYHLLKKSGVQAYPMVVSTREHGKVNVNNPVVYQFDRTVVYVPVDSTANYVLDAADKYNIYSETPDYLLNSSGLLLDKEGKRYRLVPLEKKESVKKIISINAEVKPDGKIAGTIEGYDYSYNRIKTIKKYKTDGEKQYIDYLQGGDNSLKITAVKFENMEVDTLPLVQHIDFNQDLTGSDGTYIYFKPNIMAPEYGHDFLSEGRTTDIDFAYPNIYSISGIYKIPANYKVDALPKSVSMAMSDNGITFKRVVAEQDGSIIVRYVLNFKQAIYHSIFYPEFREFFKKMNEMMNEQVVLKKI